MDTCDPQSPRLWDRFGEGGSGAVIVSCLENVYPDGWQMMELVAWMSLLKDQRWQEAHHVFGICVYSSL